jgi:signal transduction histidine kinase
MQHRLADLLEAEAAGAGGSVRLLFAATARSSEEVIEALEPRLGYRLQATAACLPSLATQPDRAPSVACSYLRLVCGRYGLGPAEFSDLALEAIASYHWPGNVEELRAAVTRAAFRVQGRRIEPADLGFGGHERSTRPLSSEVAATPQPPASEPVPPPAEQGRDFAQIGYELAHEIKNPLVSIKTFTQLLAERFDDHEFRDQYYQLVLADVDRIDSILSEIIDYAQIPQHGAGPTDLNKVTRSVVNEFRFHARQQGAQIALRLTRTSVSVAVDQVVARYVLSNVIRDGLASLGAAGRIEIHTTAAEQEGQLSVRYNLPRGEGRPGSEQASSASPRRMLGLPLTLAAKALEVHLGSLEVNDTAEGQVTVTCRFPTGAE